MYILYVELFLNCLADAFWTGNYMVPCCDPRGASPSFSRVNFQSLAILVMYNSIPSIFQYLVPSLSSDFNSYNFLSVVFGAVLT